MAITRKTLITFVFTILFFGSSVRCRTTAIAVTPASAVTPDNGLYLYLNFEYFD